MSVVICEGECALVVFSQDKVASVLSEELVCAGEEGAEKHLVAVIDFEALACVGVEVEGFQVADVPVDV